MSDQPLPQIEFPNPTEISSVLNDIALSSGRLTACLLETRLNGNTLAPSDDLGLSKAFLSALSQLAGNPIQIAASQMNLWHNAFNLWQATTLRMLGVSSTPAAQPAKGDRRFLDDAWEDDCLFNFIKQFYLLTARWLHTTMTNINGLDEQTARKVDFYTQQFIDALAPTNFVLTNPEVLRETVETGGQNLIKGIRNLLEDMERGKGKLNIRMTDLETFRLGENIAVTPGKVVFQNELFQLLQYEPNTDKVNRRPLMIVPPWINKFYILDLRAKNSFIKWAIDQGNTVFVISWVNPTADYADTSFDDYLSNGTLAALDAVEQATGEHNINAIGYCLGGTLLGATLGYLAQVGDERIRSATFFTTLLDFTNPGELEVFLDEEQISALEKRMNARGFLEGSEMATTFSMLRANDLIWSFFINNYLLGKSPFPFDLLYWNSDSTRMPAAMHSYYLRNMYLKNLLKEPGGIHLNGQAIDLRKVKIPAYFLSTIEDHIAPWKSTYAGAHLFSGPIRFVLGASGHIAGVINPPAAGKYCYWTNDEFPDNPQTWLDTALRHPGSWWEDWRNWLADQDNEQVNARIPGGGQLLPLEDAPGSYVKYRLSH